MAVRRVAGLNTPRERKGARPPYLLASFDSDAEIRVGGVVERNKVLDWAGCYKPAISNDGLLNIADIDTTSK